MSSNIEEQDSLQYESETSHHYVNVTFHQDKEEEWKPALPPRPDKAKLEATGGGGGQNEYEKIKEREDDLERIHRRSRELIRGHFDGPPTNHSFRPARHAVPMIIIINKLIVVIINIYVFTFQNLSVNNFRP